MPSALVLDPTPDDIVLSYVVLLLNQAMVRLEGGMVCQMCQERDDAHRWGCPIPALEDWLCAR